MHYGYLYSYVNKENIEYHSYDLMGITAFLLFFFPLQFLHFLLKFHHQYQHNKNRAFSSNN